MARHDVCVLGPVTRDIIARPGWENEVRPGGVPVYAGLAYAGLGLDAAVVTRLAAADRRRLLGPLETAGLTVHARPSAATTVFENRYAGAALEARRQVVRSFADPLAVTDLDAIEARVWHLGPLTNADLPFALVEVVIARGGLVALDVQGLLRAARRGAVRDVDWPDKARGLALTTIVKADAAEARLLSGEPDPARAARAIAALGPAEVIVTLGSRGALVWSGGTLDEIPAVPLRALADSTGADPTGAGDTFLAGYVFSRLRGDSPRGAGRFAAVLASLKLERAGPICVSTSAVAARLREV